MRTARHGRHALAVDLDPGVVVAHPLPVFAGTDRARDGFTEDLGQGFAEQVQQRIRQLVDAHVVVFPVRAGALQGPRIALLAVGRHAEGDGAVAVGLVGHAEALAFPFARLLQQVAPGDVGVLAAVEADAGHALDDRFIHVRQQAAIVRHARQDRQVQLGDAERQVGAIGLAPGGDGLAVDGHHARHRAAVVDGAKKPVPGRRIVQVHAKIALDAAVPGGFMVIGELDRLLHERIHSFSSSSLLRVFNRGAADPALPVPPPWGPAQAGWRGPSTPSGIPSPRARRPGDGARLPRPAPFPRPPACRTASGR
ncbi:hypothetical protein FQZ97_770310 [compost metagenome]